MQRRFLLNSELVIKRLLRSVMSSLKRSSVLSKEEFATSNLGGAGAECNCALRVKGIMLDDQSNQIHIMTARSDIGILSEELQMQWDHTVWASGGNGFNCDIDKVSIVK